MEPRPTFEQESRLQAAGYQRVAGADEAGRGPLAGPVVAAAVVLPLGEPDDWARLCHDSKLLTERQRLQAYDQVTARAAWAVALADVVEIDEIGIARASTLAMRRAVEQLDPAPDFVLTDAFAIDGLGLPQLPIVHGDRLCLSIAAASIVAKVTRDRLMAELEVHHPGYGFCRHKGYGTAEHLARLAELGPSPVHRRSFAPVRCLLLPPAPADDQ